MYPSWWGQAFERLAAVTPARLVVLRWDGRGEPVVVWANPAAAALIAMTPEGAVGRPVSEVYPAQYLSEIIEQLRQARSEGSLVYEVVRELPSGRRTLAVITVALADDHFLSFALDRTAEREAQRRLGQVTKVTGAGMYHWNVTDNAVSWTDELFRLFGYSPGEVEPTPERYLQHVHPDDRGGLEDATNAARAGTVANSHSRHRIIPRDGGVRTVDVRIQTASDDAGQLLYVLGVVRDVTDEVELARHTERAQRASEQQQTALTVHDKVVQALATVVLALDLDEPDVARHEALAAMTAAQQVVADLLTEVGDFHGSVAPGTLRTAHQHDLA
jgi:PAS domain S-box-containing protein